VPVPGGAPAAAAAAIAGAALHAVVSLDGYDVGHRADALALRPAPVTLSWFGFLGTTGAAYVDGVVADAIALPAADAALYAERAVLRHPTTLFVADHAAQHPEVAAADAAGAPSANASAPGFTFCAFSQLFKVSPAAAAAWARILDAAPGARLLLFDHPPISRAGLLAAHPRLAAAAAAGRLHFVGRLPRGEHLLRKRAQCSLALDTETYNGHSVAADLLFAHVPVLTLGGQPGAAMHGRAAASIAAAAGAPPFFYDSADFDEYERRAARLHAAYAAARSGAAPAAADAADGVLWRPAHDAPLWDTARWVREFEDVVLSWLGGEERRQRAERGAEL